MDHNSIHYNVIASRCSSTSTSGDHTGAAKQSLRGRRRLIKRFLPLRDCFIAALFAMTWFGMHGVLRMAARLEVILAAQPTRRVITRPITPH